MRNGSVIEDLIAIVERTERASLAANYIAYEQRSAAGSRTSDVNRESATVRELNSDAPNFVYSLQKLEQAVIGVA
jgi:hypothetical protein